MTDHAILASRSDSKIDRYRRRERALWAHHGLAPTERFIDLRSPRVRLRVLEVGSGEPVLFVHGTIGPGSWASLLGELPGVRAIVLDRPGWGLSDPVDFSTSPYRPLVADILVQVLDRLGIDRVTVLGGSVGDVWALSLAEAHPARVQRVVMLGAGPVVSDVPVPAFIRVVRSPIGALIVRLPMSRDRLLSILRDNGHGASLAAGRIPDEFIDWRLSLANDTIAMRHERDMVRSILGRSGWQPGFAFEAPDLGRIRQPAMLVHGSNDPTGSVELWRRVMTAMPLGELEVVEGAGHQPWFDDAPSVAARVTGFLTAG
jgi:2-hydroxy-6-oxonona-2,4-dienedioate hydrolase